MPYHCSGNEPNNENQETMDTCNKKIFRKTYRHEVIIEAETNEEAQQIWESISLGNLDQAQADGEIYSHEFVENSSFEDENYEDV